MKRTVLGGVLVVGLCVGALESLAVAFPIQQAPLNIHDWWPFPVACAGARCVTYRQWTGLIKQAALPTEQAGSSEDTDAMLLTELLTARAAALVARRSGLGVTTEEIENAARALHITTASEPAITQFLAARAINPQSSAFRSGLVDMLLRAKLAATGITDVWAHPAAPSIAIFHARYRWDESARQVVSR